MSRNLNVFPVSLHIRCIRCRRRFIVEKNSADALSVAAVNSTLAESKHADSKTVNLELYIGRDALCNADISPIAEIL